jgi:hypothetical protein
MPGDAYGKTIIRSHHYIPKMMMCGLLPFLLPLLQPFPQWRAYSYSTATDSYRPNGLLPSFPAVG